MSIPPKWVMSQYLSLEPPGIVDIATIKAGAVSDGMAWQFVRAAEEHGLIVRIERGRYVAIDPGIAIRAAGLDSYYRYLLVIDSALTVLEEEHGFLCLSANEYADYVPEMVCPVLRHGIRIPSMDTFEYDFGATDVLTFSVLGGSVDIPVLSRADTAILLMSVYLPREVAAGRSILGEIPVTGSLLRKLKSLGYSDHGDVAGVERVEISFPEWILDKRKNYGENKMKLEAAGI